MPAPHDVFTAPQPESLSLPSVAILGAGAMGQSLLAGITKPGVSVRGAIRATCHSAARAADLRRFPSVVAESVEENPEANRSAAGASDLVVLAVSPDRVPAVLREVSPSLRPGTLFVSLAAGVTLSRLRSMLPDSVAVVRAIPNLPGKVGFGVTGVGANDACSSEHFQTALDLFAAVGSVVAVRDDQLDAVSSLSGSGPAYFYSFTDQMTAAGVDLGFSPEQARALAENTFLGSAALMHASGESPGELLRQLTGPKGTTAKAINEMSNGRLKAMILDAATASISRAREIAGQATE